MQVHDNKKQISEAIEWLRFPLIFLIILLHCYSTIVLPGNHTIYFKTIYPFSLWLGETGVPGFFFISGFLFFFSNKRYLQKMKSRFFSLLLPYLLWNAILLGLYVIAFIAGFPQEINGKNIADFTFIDYIRVFWDRGTYDDGNFAPILCPFWYIRNLLIMIILSPIFYYLIKYIREVFLLITIIWWLSTPRNAFIPQTILFFSLGAYFSIFKINPLDLFHKYKKWFLMLCVVFAICDTIVHTILATTLNLQIHRLALIFNIPVLFILANYCCQHRVSSKFLSKAAFIVFSIHYPIVVVMRKLCAIQLGEASDIVHIPLYFFCVLLTTTLSLLIYYIMSNLFPRIKNILSGNR